MQSAVRAIFTSAKFHDKELTYSINSVLVDALPSNEADGILLFPSFHWSNEDGLRTRALL